MHFYKYAFKKNCVQVDQNLITVFSGQAKTAKSILAKSSFGEKRVPLKRKLNRD